MAVSARTYFSKDRDMNEKILTFLHSGDAGDIIAELAAVKELCEKADTAEECVPDKNDIVFPRLYQCFYQGIRQEPYKVFLRLSKGDYILFDLFRVKAAVEVIAEILHSSHSRRILPCDVKKLNFLHAFFPHRSCRIPFFSLCTAHPQGASC